MKTEHDLLAKQIKVWTILFMVGIVLSGVTAFPIDTEIKLFDAYFLNSLWLQNYLPSIYSFLLLVSKGVHETAENYPFIFYGTDWLAFAHIIIGSAFIGVLRDPVRNIWIVEWAMLACLMVFPLAFICGPIRGIPFVWRLIDCSFGVFGMIPLVLLRNKILQLEKLTPAKYQIV
jgi:hypothetical protein